METKTIDLTIVSLSVCCCCCCGQNEATRRVEELSTVLHHFGVKKLQLALTKIGWPKPLTIQEELTAKVEIELLKRVKGMCLIFDVVVVAVFCLGGRAARHIEGLRVLADIAT